MDALYISIKDTAKLLHVSESTIRRYFDMDIIDGHLTALGQRRPLRSSVMELAERLRIVEPKGITFK